MRNIAATILIIVAGAGAVFWLYMSRLLKSFVCRRQEGLEIDYGEEFEKRLKESEEWMECYSSEEVSIKSEEGLQLFARWWDFEKDTTVLYIHGYSNTSKQAALFADLFTQSLDANILAPDNRAHGKSEGVYVGFGWQDRKDILKWIDYLINIKGVKHNIVLFGVSMGGAAVLSASGEALPDNVKMICSDCGYSSLNEVFESQIKKYVKSPKKLVMRIINYHFKRWYGFSVYDISPISQMKHTKVPVLFIHGEADHFIPVQMSYRLFDACVSTKESLIMPDAGHALSGIVDWDKYKDTIVNFYEKIGG